MRVQDVLSRIKACANELRRDHNVLAIYIFGSVARGESTKSSDIDILVEFNSPDVGLFEFYRLKQFLEKKLKGRVDLVTRDALKTSMIRQIERECVRAA